MSVKIVVLGSINRDFITKTPRFPKVGESVEGCGMSVNPGGKGSNQAVQAALLGADTRFIGCVGDDENGGVLVRSLAAKGVGVEYLWKLPGKETGNCLIFIDSNGDNLLVHNPGTNKMITKEHIDSAAEEIRSADILMTQNEINQDAVIYGLRLAKEAGVATVLNPAPALPLPEEVYSLADYITPNETESEAYTGILRSEMPFDEWKAENARWFLKRGSRGVCLTLGEKGSFFSDGRREVDVPAFEIAAVDTTAAGDAFNAGFAYGIALGWDTEKILRFANACGALASTRMGAQPSIPKMNEVEEFMAGQ